MEEQITIEYDDAGVAKTIFTLPRTKAPDMRSVYVFSLPKAGSVLLDNIMRGLSEQVGVTYVSLMGEFFKLGLAEQDVPSATSNVFADQGYCFGGFRALESPRSRKDPDDEPEVDAATRPRSRHEPGRIHLGLC